ncbi:MAG: gamma-glutamyl-gamma-aminobutyrate hydrolase family protein, partial [Candidatus Aminicenantes bacterium]|nr:gamma-glutamyl-gamma-aminobutyrate hydrolase family protein [Candidatus Aminicenantes bacterium]
KGDINQDELFRNNLLTSEFAKIFKKSDGIIFFGGADIPPYIYGEKTDLLTSIDTPYRSMYELSFIFHLLGGFQNQEFTPFLDSSPNYPILGICLGAQSLNTATGGTLIQDIWKDIYGQEYLEDIINMPESIWHTNPHARLHPEKDFFPYKMHPIKLDPKGKFVREFGFKAEDTPYILSAHHQAADRIGLGFFPMACSLDEKVVEAIEHERFPYVLGVQFHPEFPLLYDETSRYIFTPEDTEKTNIFALLKENPPSYAFHQKIWEWFSTAIQEYHQRNSGAGPR